MKTWESLGIDLHGKTGNVYTTCPKCSKDRSKSGARCLHVDTVKGVYFCNHCSWSGGLNERVFGKPEYVAPTEVDNRLAGWFEKRGIPASVVLRNKIDLAKSFMPQLNGETWTIQFPYYENGECVNVKFRSMEGKHFRQIANARKTLFGIDDVHGDTCIIVEGEIDKLSFEVAGVLNAVSVPDGAPPEGSKPSDRKFEYLQNDLLASVKKIIVATDNDGPGLTLQEELVRRLGPDRCWRVTWPSDCKDANEVLLKHGVDAVLGLIEQAKPCPIDGVLEVNDVVDQVLRLYEDGLPSGLSTGWASMDKHYTVQSGEMTIVTGIPGDGKSEWLDALMANMAMQHDWSFAVCSPENMPLQRHISKLIEKFVGLPFGRNLQGRMQLRDVAQALELVQRHFVFIAPDESITIDSLLETARSLVTRYGIRGLVIDPWNEFDHRRPPGITETEYISQALGKIRRFGRAYGVHIWIVAHPAKLIKDEDGRYPVPTPYDISGSANWRNKADNCITVWRNMKEDPFGPTVVHVQKIRFKENGCIGRVKLQWNPSSGRYDEVTT